MSKKRYINTSFWRDDYIDKLDANEKLVFLYLITNPDTNISGIYQIKLKTISIDTGIKHDSVINILSRLQKDGKILYKHGWMAIRNFIKHQVVNPKVQAGIDRELSHVPPFLADWCSKDSLLSEENRLLSTENSLSIDYDSLSKNELSKGLSKGKDRLSFTPPSVDSVQAFLDEKNITLFTGQEFVDYYSVVGWVYGKNKIPMKDWQAAVRNWIKNHKKNPTEADSIEERVRRGKEARAGGFNG